MFYPQFVHTAFNDIQRCRVEKRNFLINRSCTFFSLFKRQRCLLAFSISPYDESTITNSLSMTARCKLKYFNNVVTKFPDNLMLSKKKERKKKEKQMTDRYFQKRNAIMDL